MKLITSNSRKLAEFKRFGLNFAAENGPDLKEVAGNADEVIVYKALDAGKLLNEKDIIVEDTTLLIVDEDANSEEEIIDIRWRIHELASLPPNKKIIWRVSLGHNDGEFIKVYKGETLCKVDTSITPEKVPAEAFGFDAYLIADGQIETVYKLEKRGEKDMVSPRKKAVTAFIHDQLNLQRKISEIPQWKGKYQNN